MIVQSLQADGENSGLFRWGEPCYWISQTLIIRYTRVKSDLKYLPPQGTSVCGSTSGFSLKRKKKVFTKWSALKFLQKTSMPPEITLFLVYFQNVLEHLPEINRFLYLPTCKRTWNWHVGKYTINQLENNVGTSAAMGVDTSEGKVWAEFTCFTPTRCVMFEVVFLEVMMVCIS